MTKERQRDYFDRLVNDSFTQNLDDFIFNQYMNCSFMHGIREFEIKEL